MLSTDAVIIITARYTAFTTIGSAPLLLPTVAGTSVALEPWNAVLAEPDLGLAIMLIAITRHDVSFQVNAHSSKAIAHPVHVSITYKTSQFIHGFTVVTVLVTRTSACAVPMTCPSIAVRIVEAIWGSIGLWLWLVLGIRRLRILGANNAEDKDDKYN